ncbi:ribonuclease H-like domain-containing protein [Thermothelomyces heterothallicus CBS 202.75]|uniref:ribonuclease H-like domain-containing protein n=1 Tax=Thermothelomyces heterothallicus CBS 202.75 TaxID=1149848 RepID=UPI0037436505
MASRKAVHQVWHVSRGIVFSGGSDVVYPRLHSLRYCSATAAVASEGDPVSVPSAPAMADMTGGPSTSQGPEDLLSDAVTTSLSTTTTTTTTTRTITTSAATANVTATADGAAVVKDQSVVTDTVEKPKPKPKHSSTPDAVPFTPLDFKIPEKAFQAARRAPKGSPESFWNYSLYRGPGADGSRDVKVKIHYCTSMLTTERVVKQYFMNEKVVGFDLEWMSNAQRSSGPRKNVSLIQLASPSRIGLFHIASYPSKDKLVAPALKKLMEDPSITKVGVWIKGDCTRLADYLGIKTQGQFELSHLYKLVKYSASGDYDSINKKLVSLATQVKEYLGLPVFKGDDVRTSNWTRRLNMDQIMYSSSDAYAAVQLFAVLNYQRQKLDPVPDLPHHAELNLPIPVARPVAPAVIQEEDGGDPNSISEQDAARRQDVAKTQDANGDTGGCNPVLQNQPAVGACAGEHLENMRLAEPPGNGLASREEPSRWKTPVTQSKMDAEQGAPLNFPPLAILNQQDDQSKQATTS